MSPSGTAILGERYTEIEGSALLSGVQALVRLPLDQHRLDAQAGMRTATFISGYPGSPLGGYDLELGRRSKLLSREEVTHVPAVNEELAATAVWGSQLVETLPEPRFEGVVGLWYGKAPGLDRATDPIRHANLAGTAATGGALALVGDDAAAKSSTVPSASEPTLAALNVPTLCPGNAQEVLDLGLHGIAMSRCAGLWAAIKIATAVADGFGTVEVSEGRVQPRPVAAELDGRPYRHVPTMELIGEQLLALERSLYEARLPAAVAYSRANRLNRITGCGGGGRIGFVASGKAYYELRQALADLGLGDAELERLGVRLLQVRMPFPLDGELVREFADGLEEVVVVEDKQPFLERLIKDELFNAVRHPAVIGSRDERGDPLLPRGGELGVDTMAKVVGERVLRYEELAPVRRHLERLERAPSARPLPIARAPYFCSGCPHNTSVTRLPEGAIVGAGIGCHGMATMMRSEDVGNVTGLTQMGGEGAHWIGQAPFTGTGHVFQNVGDGTFHHSASLAIRASVAAGTNITYKLLWNSHIAMTGGQPPTPAMSLSDVTRWLLAESVRRVLITSDDPARTRRATDLPGGVEIWERSRILEAQELLAGIEGTTVLIHDQECAAELRRRRKRGSAEDPARHVFINERVCEGCGDCGEKSNCLSVHPVETEFGRKTQIHQESCNKDYSCLEGDCPSFLVVTPGEGGERPELPVPLAAEELPEPDLAVDADGFTLRITGIGGSGVLTVSQTLAAAAGFDGLFVAGLDQTGLAQKGGPVVSDVKLSRSPVATANRLTAFDCDLYLAADLLTGAEAKNLAAADPERTVAVISTTRVPTGRMVVDTEAHFPDRDRLVERILGRSRREHSVEVEAAELARRLAGSEIASNMLLVGAAYQAGALPISAASIERAIEANGAAVEINLQAFRRGRQAVSDPDGLRRALAEPSPAPTAERSLSKRERRIAERVGAAPDSDLRRLVDSRVGELSDYQSPAYAERYAETVERVRAAESERVPGRGQLAEAVAFFLHKLMAYKDEYEVARLHLDPQLRRELEARFGAGARFSWKLQPPLLRAAGLDRKISIGAWFTPIFRVLVAMRRLRGSRLDPFGRGRVRRTEQELIVEYETTIDYVLERLEPENHAIAVEIARLPDLVRGYEQVKLAGVERYRARLDELRERLEAPGTVIELEPTR